MLQDQIVIYEDNLHIYAAVLDKFLGAKTVVIRPSVSRRPAIDKPMITTIEHIQPLRSEGAYFYESPPYNVEMPIYAIVPSPEATSYAGMEAVPSNTTNKLFAYERAWEYGMSFLDRLHRIEHAGSCVAVREQRGLEATYYYACPQFTIMEEAPYQPWWQQTVSLCQAIIKASDSQRAVISGLGQNDLLDAIHLSAKKERKYASSIKCLFDTFTRLQSASTRHTSNSVQFYRGLHGLISYALLEDKDMAGTIKKQLDACIKILLGDK